MESFCVCVVDDHPENIAVLCEGLRHHGFHTVAAESGDEALTRVAEGRVDLMLLDINLPDMSGFEVCRSIKANPATAQIGVIFCSVRDEKFDLKEGFAAGAMDYITKPYNLPMVMLRVEAAAKALRAAGADMMTDQLTGLCSRAYLMKRLQEEVERAHRYDFPVSFVLFDLDEIEAHDEDLGPVSMDDLLAEVAMAINTHTRSFDTLARVEGTLFAALLPHCSAEQAEGYANKIMEQVSATTFCDPSFPTRASLSAGAACCRNGVAYSAEFVNGEAMRSLFQAQSQQSGGLVIRDLSS